MFVSVFVFFFFGFLCSAVRSRIIKQTYLQRFLVNFYPHGFFFHRKTGNNIYNNFTSASFLCTLMLVNLASRDISIQGAADLKTITMCLF